MASNVKKVVSTTILNKDQLNSLREIEQTITGSSVLARSFIGKSRYNIDYVISDKFLGTPRGAAALAKRWEEFGGTYSSNTYANRTLVTFRMNSVFDDNDLILKFISFFKEFAEKWNGFDRSQSGTEPNQDVE